MPNDFNIENIDESLLNSLNDNEKNYVLQILKEFEKEGKSDSFNNIIFDDYKEIPVDIETFLTDDNYLGKAWKDSTGKLKIYPFWMDILKKLFPNNVDTNYTTLLETGARGIGKSEIACGCVGTYLLYRVMCLKNPLEFYRLKPTEKICFAFMNIKKDLAEGIATEKFQKTLQMSPWFMSKGKITQRNNKPYWVPPEPINFIIGSQADDVIGLPIYFAFFDEISFIKNQDIDKQKAKAKDMIDTAIGGMVTRFIYNGKNPTVLVVASSKRSEQSFMEQYIKTLSKNDAQNVLVVDKPVWEVKPPETYGKGTFNIALGNKFLESMIIPDNDHDLIKYENKGYKILKVPLFFKAKFNEDIDRNLCDIAGISSTSLSKYMNGSMVANCINDEFYNPFPDIIEVGNAQNDLAQYKNFFNVDNIPNELKYKPLFIHLDMSLSGDMTGIAGVWIIGKKPSTDELSQNKDLMFRLAFSTSIKAPKGHQISFEKNRNFIRWLKSEGFNIKKITSDTYQSADLLQQLSAEGYDCEILSVDRVDTDKICKPYQYLRSTIYEKRFIMYRSKRLFDEFIDIERNLNTGKIDHSPNGHKDALDAVCGATFTASKFAEQYAFDYGETLDAITEVSSDSILNEKEQIIIDFEKELTKILDPMNKTNINNKNNDEQFMDFGYGKATKDYTSVYISNGILNW